MKRIVLSVDNLRERASKLRLIKNEYDDCQQKINVILKELETVYKESGEPIISEAVNISSTMQEMMDRLTLFAEIFEERADGIENANID